MGEEDAKSSTELDIPHKRNKVELGIVGCLLCASLISKHNHYAAGEYLLRKNVKRDIEKYGITIN